MEFFKLAQVTESLPINQIELFKKSYAGSILHFSSAFQDHVRDEDIMQSCFSS